MPQDTRAAQQRFSLRLLGRWQLVVDGAEVELGHREERLAALLGLTGRSSRLHVAGTLWPESTDERALASLRRAVLQTQQRSPGLLQADRLTIGLGDDVEVDVDDVRRAAAAAEAPLADGAVADLPSRLAVPGLLPDWYDDWVLQQREALERLRVKGLERVARHGLDVHDLALTAAAADAASDIDPLLEWASELAIRAHLECGDLGSARREFDRYRTAMRSELDAPPSRTILDLVEPALATAPPVPPVPPEPTEPLPAHDQVRVAPPPVRTRPVIAIPEPVPGPARPVEARRALLRLLGVAALVLAVALAVAGIGHRDGVGGAGDPPGSTGSPMRVLPAGAAIQAGQMVVRPVGAAVGSAVFLVRSTLRPAVVRLEVQGRTGAGVVRTVLVRSAHGRVLELAGLDPGVYRWLATSSVASTVSGRLRVPGPPATADTADTGGVLEAAAPASSGTTSVEPAAATPTASASSTASPDRPSDEGTPSGAAPAARPASRPVDPGTAPPNPVG
ncbi:hypothetical protein ASC77_24055 [Nocardioides sp. Root1257]|uniref:AfsR/SARP family transcriptional regulator n=1 Tax=unclassified Nocardioides TaxID=2615069 RepID=UPI0006F75C2F|nr:MULTISPECIES: BTAD domain-containing putative transcriptional regulator [unclassified Nocardioides]KQW52463.1 hypothetical protein ASC77_24055 [Nocardioides sp. Root1257]KRC54526.1 hypothetical protein ASE24_23850 [Nocardioides sp. Root224]